MFQRDLYLNDEKLKTENNIADDLSEIDANIQSEIEQKRREFWVEKLENMYEILSHLKGNLVQRNSIMSISSSSPKTIASAPNHHNSRTTPALSAPLHTPSLAE